MKLDPTKFFDVRHKGSADCELFSFRAHGFLYEYQLVLRLTGTSVLYGEDLLLEELSKEDTEDAVRILRELNRLESIQKRERLLNAITQTEAPPNPLPRPMPSWFV